MSTLGHPFLFRKGTGRINVPGLRVRTSNFTDVPSSMKAQAIASSDWRKSASAESSSCESFRNVSPIKRRRNQRSSLMSEFMLEMEENKPPLYHPKEDLASWEMVVSAPVGHLSSSPAGGLSSSSSSVSSGMSFEEITAIKVSDAKPMTMKVNGEELVVNGSFTFDVTPIGRGSTFGGDGSIRRTLGILTRVGDHSKLQRMVLRGEEIMNDLPWALQGMLRSGQSECNGFGGPMHQSHQETRESTQSEILRESYLRAPGGRVSYSSPQAQTRSMNDDEARFQGMLSRLRRSPARQRGESPISDIQAKDPAIIAAKVKHTGKQNRQAGAEPVITVLAPQHVGWERRGEQGSHDSGYASGQSAESIHIPSAMRRSLDENNRSSTDDAAARRLNPAAAEFKTTFNEQFRPFISPKKMARPPLTNIFPEVARDLPARSSGGPEARQHMSMMQAVEESGGRHEPLYNPRSAVPEPLAPANSVLSPHKGFECYPGGMPGRRMYPEPGYQQPQGQVPFDLVATVNELIQRHLSNLRPGSMSGNYGTFPPPGMMLPPNEMEQCPMANADGFGTYPGPAPALVPTLEPQSRVGIPTVPVLNPTPAVAPTPVLAPTPPIPYTIYGQPPLVGTDSKVPVAPRPHFPVTQKPRDHDPVKQQQYEAYLEWRKANEPGYHMKCKMRQAQRVVRQYQQRQQGSVINPAYKTIIEQAKAAVGAAAAAAAAEKLAREESVRQELKVKVRERSEGSGHGEVKEESDMKSEEESASGKEESKVNDQLLKDKNEPTNGDGEPAKDAEKNAGGAKDEKA